MDKMIFVNDDIFQSDGDYIIGGFETSKVEDFKYADFETALRSRIEDLIEVYLQEAALYNISLGMANPEKEAREDLALVINDNLKVEVPFLDTESVIDTIMNNDKTRTWLLGIKQNIMDYEQQLSSKYKGVYNQAVEMDASSPEYQNAQYFTETTFEEFIEQLSSIEL